jgi:2-polyprenyl-3-methyl-5-hydroxy-6-metoxy-1,4-benzoquinol methylase
MLIVPREDPTPADAHRPQVAWEEAPCAQCAGRHWTPLIEAQDPDGGEDGLWFAVVQCDSCGTCFTNPRPDRVSIHQFYPDSYTPHQKHHQHRSAGWRPFGWLNRPRVEKRPIPWHGKGRLLDFGCGSGKYLAAMHRRGWRVTGVDVSAGVAERIRSEAGLTAYAGTLPHRELEPESFDVITMWHSLEHVHDPAAVLREARDLLAPGGKLVVAVPNIDSLPFRWFGRHWFGLDLPRHLTHFTPTSLSQMLQRCGFRTDPIRGVPHADWLRRSAAIACRRLDPPPWLRALTYRIPSIAAAWWCDHLGQSDCMVATAWR